MARYGKAFKERAVATQLPHFLPRFLRLNALRHKELQALGH